MSEVGLAPNPPGRRSFLPDWKNFVTGATSGAVSRTLTNPLERLKILRQLGISDYKGKGLFKSLGWMWTSEGFYGFFKGNGINVVRIAPFVAFQFYFYELFKRVFFPQEETNVYAIKFVCGGLSGIVTSTLTYPLDFLRTFMAIQTSVHKTEKVVEAKPSMVKSFVKVVRSDGFFGLYKGWLMSMCGIAPYLAIKLSCFDWLATRYMPNKKSKLFDVANLSIGGLAGSIAATITYPTDVIRRKMQLRGLDPSVPNYKGIVDCIIKMYQAEGMKSYYNGLIANYLKVIPSSALMFGVNERMKKWFRML